MGVKDRKLLRRWKKLKQEIVLSTLGAWNAGKERENERKSIEVKLSFQYFL
jgi:hypothetical protein